MAEKLFRRVLDIQKSHLGSQNLEVGTRSRPPLYIPPLRCLFFRFGVVRTQQDSEGALDVQPRDGRRL
jgi:hypothetical protein